MTKITYKDKMDFLEDLQKRQKFLNESCKTCLTDVELNRNLDIIECIMEDVRDFKSLNEERGKDYVVFYDGKEDKYYLFLHNFRGLFHWQTKIEISKNDYYIINRMLENISTAELLNKFLDESKEKTDEKNNR